MLPEVALNVMGTMWMFCEVIECTVSDKFSSIVIQSKQDGFNNFLELIVYFSLLLNLQIYFNDLLKNIFF